MKYFIFGGRRSGKTTQVLKILEKMDSEIVWETLYSRRQEYSRVLGGRKIHSNHKGLRNYVTVYDNVERHFNNIRDSNYLKIFHPEFPQIELEHITIKNYVSALDLFGTHTIVTCTPDNTEDNPNTPSYILYTLAKKSPHWQVIDLGFYNEFIKTKDHLPEHLQLGQIYGNWYDKDKAEMEKKAKEEENKQIPSDFLDWTFN